MRTLDLTNSNGMRVRVLEHGCTIVTEDDLVKMLQS